MAKGDLHITTGDAITRFFAHEAAAGERNTVLILNNNHRNPGKPAYCSGDLSDSTLPQVSALTPHVLDFLGLPNATVSRKHPRCNP